MIIQEVDIYKIIEQAGAPLTILAGVGYYLVRPLVDSLVSLIITLQASTRDIEKKQSEMLAILHIIHDDIKQRRR